MAKRKTKVARKKKTPQKKKSLIGINPLAWLDEEEGIEENSIAETSVVEPVLSKVSAKKIKSDNSSVEIDLGTSLTMREIEPLHTRLKDYLNQDQPIKINGGDVEKADAAALQLLTVFQYAAVKQGLTVEWQASSDVLRHAVKLLDLTESIGLSE